ncbi:Methyltransf_11 domain-containing protein [Rubrivivax sp. A210]|uniref:class I SAM-dependent methyltransferase n=1 Tax=Rubrivivax sp. A210 TaxID=2772301 RepID=UPI001919491A|nr:class I SAM-dependent methyltransferase [Rubrivivax sp. A210]CAD5371283.1 Methyltransf_11 domain-containing protein [Rubrivivax sp. A210]
MRRLKRRRLGLLQRDYLVHRALWPAIEAAVAGVLQGRDRAGLTVIDLGCGEGPYADLFEGCRRIAIDRSCEGAAPDLLADVAALPLAGGCADIVFCTQVIEHVPRPDRLLAECCRTLRPGGQLVLTGPFYWPLHEEPHDYYRYTRHGFAHLLREAGLLPLQIVPDCGSVTQAAVSLIEALPRWALVLLPLINALTPLLQRGSNDCRSPLNYVIVARKP